MEGWVDNYQIGAFLAYSGALGRTYPISRLESSNLQLEGNSPVIRQLQPNITSTIINPHASLTVIGVAAGQRGPWPVVSGVLDTAVDMVAPPPEYLAVAAWAA